MSKYKILIIDDDILIINMISTILRSRGYEVFTAFNGEDGLAKAKSEHPDLILLDIIMPKINGYEVCTKLKSEIITKNIVVIMITGNWDRESVLNSRKVGADDYINKPFAISTLLDKLSQQLDPAFVN
jgi:PleD family two-component response regulator